MHDRYISALLGSIDARLRDAGFDRAYDSGRPDRDNDRLLRQISRNMERMMATLQETLEAVTRSGDRLDSLVTLVEGLRQQVKDALANSGISAEDQAKIDAIFAEANENVAKTDAALNANVPPAPPADPVP